MIARGDRVQRVRDGRMFIVARLGRATVFITPEGGPEFYLGILRAEIEGPGLPPPALPVAYVKVD